MLVQVQPYTFSPTYAIRLGMDAAAGLKCERGGCSVKAVPEMIAKKPCPVVLCSRLGLSREPSVSFVVHLHARDCVCFRSFFCDEGDSDSVGMFSYWRALRRTYSSGSEALGLNARGGEASVLPACGDVRCAVRVSMSFPFSYFGVPLAQLYHTCEQRKLNFVLWCL